MNDLLELLAAVVVAGLIFAITLLVALAVLL